jgi:hypothetical protein
MVGRCGSAGTAPPSCGEPGHRRRARRPEIRRNATRRRTTRQVVGASSALAEPSRVVVPCRRPARPRSNTIWRASRHRCALLPLWVGLAAACGADAEPEPEPEPLEARFCRQLEACHYWSAGAPAPARKTRGAASLRSPATIGANGPVERSAA